MATPGTEPDQTPKDKDLASVDGPSHTTRRERRDRQDLVDDVIKLTDSILADPSHPWNREWPTVGEMAEALDSNHKSVSQALQVLGDRGLYAKVPVRRQRRVSAAWIPTHHIDTNRHITDDEMIASITELARTEEWTILPSYDDLEEHFHAPRSAVSRVVKVLAHRKLIVRYYDKKCWRWRLVVASPGPRGINPAHITTPAKRAIANLTRRLNEGEFRYRTPDGVIHEEPFLSSHEIAAQYSIGISTAKDVLRQLLHEGWIIRTHHNSPCVPSDRVPAVDRLHAAPPRQRPPRGGGPKRVGQLTKDLVERIESGEFSAAGFPSGGQLIAQYRTSRPIIQQVLDELHRRDLIDFEWVGGYRRAQLAHHLRSPEHAQIG